LRRKKLKLQWDHDMPLDHGRHHYQHFLPATVAMAVDFDKERNERFGFNVAKNEITITKQSQKLIN